MGHGKEKQALEYCLDDRTLQQVIGDKAVKKIQEYLLTLNAVCPLKQFTNTLDKHHLTHLEGSLNNKREEPNYVVNIVTMKGDSNTPKQRMLFERKIKGRKVKAELICDSYGIQETRHNNAKKKIKTIEQSQKIIKKYTDGDVPICSCTRKIIFSDTVAQTDVPLQKNKRTNIFRRNIAKAQPKVKYDGDKIDISSIKYTKQGTKSNSPCPCIGQELNELENMQQQKGNTQRQNISPEKRKRRSRTISLWSPKVNEVADPVQIKSYKQTSTLNCICENEPKLKETSKFPKEIPKVPCGCPTKVPCGCPPKHPCGCSSKVTCRYPPKVPCGCPPKVPCGCPPKEYREGKVKHKNICAKGICPEAYESKSMIDVKKLTSLIKCMCKFSKKSPKNETTIREPVCDPEECKRYYEVTKFDKKVDRTGEPKIKTKETSKRKHKKLPKETEKPEHFIAIPETAGDGTGDLIIRIKKPSEIKHKKLPKDICFYLDTNQKNAGDRKGDKIKDPSKIKNKKTVKKSELSERITINPKSAGDQTVEPLQIEVDAINRCILNADEIKHKLANISHVKKPTCVCPSRNAARDECEGKICQKMFKEKKTNFNCKCQHHKDVVGECSDRTCGSYVNKKRHNKCSDLCVDLPEMNEPQFEVRLDAKKMCILNSDEINKKIIEKEAEAYEICPGGACAAACENGSSFICKCTQKKPKDIAECSEPTCVDSEPDEVQVDVLYYWMSKLFGKVNKKSSHNRMTRNPFDTKEIRKIKSMFTFICDRLKRTSEIWNGSEATKKTGCSLSGLNQQQKNTANKPNYHKRSGLTLPLKKNQPNKASTTKTLTNKQDTEAKKSESSSCGCAKELAKRKLKKVKDKDKNASKVDKKKKKERARQRKLEMKARAKHEKEQHREMIELENMDEATDTSCFADFISGIFNVAKGLVACLLMLVFKVITEPKTSYTNTRQWLKDPQHTLQRVQRWVAYRWRVQKFYMSKSVKGSESLTTILDVAKETPAYKAFASKGRNAAERQMLESQSRRRQMRIRKKAERAVHGCRDILLVTMRRTPCLWIYHLCPDFYPRFLSLRTNCIQFLQMFMFCFAVLFWTPCILCMELCRGFMCCVTCSV